MGLNDLDTRSGILDREKDIFSCLEEKLDLFNRYLSITKRMKADLDSREASNLGGFLSERQDCIKRIQKIDLSLEKIIKTGAYDLKRISGKFMKLVDGYLANIKRITETVDLMDRELMDMVKEESGGIKGELLRIRNVRQGARGYRREEGYSPRFLDTIR